MQNKKQFSQLLLGIALVLSLLRSDDNSSLRPRNSNHLFRLPELQDILLGQTAVLTQTEFHNLFNSEGGDYVHPKSLQRDSRFIHSLLDNIDPERWMDMSPYREVTALLLDRLESSNGRQLYFNHANNNNHGEDENGNQGNEDNIGAMAIPSPTDELTQEDMDVIERLWRQDIDMGICRDDSLSTKEGYEIEKPLKKPEENPWDNFSIDNETGEFMQPVIDPASQVNTQQITTIPQQTQLPFPGQTTENGMTLEECLQILEEDFSNPLQSSTRQEPDPAMHHPIHSPQEMEQRWQDFASLSDINLNLPAISPEVSAEYNPEYHQQAVMAENFTTMGSPINFGMNLPNTTENLNMLHYPSSHHPTNLPTSMHSSDDVFTSGPTLSDLSVNTTSLPSASLHIPGMNFTNLLMSETNRSISEAEYSGQNDTSTSSMSSRNSTSPLLLDLLNSSTLDEVDAMDINGQIRDVMDVLDDRDSAISLGSVSQFTEHSDIDNSSLYSGSEDGSSEGAVGGYDGSLDQDVKGASGYSRGNAQYGGDRQGGGQSNHNNQQSNMNSITHNHTYSDMSSRNGSINGNSSKKSQQQRNNDFSSRYSRDEKRAKMLKLPIPVHKIIDLPVDQFNELLKKFEMTDPQLALVRDIRRRGKNKVAAQNCRKRKIDAIYTIEDEIDLLKAEKDDLLKERGNIDKESVDMRDRYTHLYREVFQSLRDDHGDPVNPNNFSLQQMPDGSVYLVPRNSTLPDEDGKDK